MKKNKIMETLGKTVTRAALSVGKSATNSACFGWLHQPQEPKSMAKYKKNV